MKISMAQINPTIGDMQGNLSLIKDAVTKAEAEGADLVVFPELSITGYYPGDLLLKQRFMAEVSLALDAVINLSKEVNVAILIGAPVPSNEVRGNALYNSLLVVKSGEVIHTYNKQLLPTYNIFDEKRHFEPGSDLQSHSFELNGFRVGTLICEDSWNKESKGYRINPLKALEIEKVDVLVSINASPFNEGKRETRHALFNELAIPVVYVNQVGGHDQLVFDGRSFVMESGVVVSELSAFDSDFLTIDLKSLPSPISIKSTSKYEDYLNQMTLGLKDYMKRCGFSKVVVGSSGGIDSALTIAIAALAIGSENVAAITMPSEYSSEGSIADSKALCDNLGVNLDVVPIKSQVELSKEVFNSTLSTPVSGLALQNLQARIRGVILMTYSNTFGHLLLTTGNKSEMAVGYATLYGDMAGGLNLIGDLYKTEVFELCRYINKKEGKELIPVVIIEKEPSAELAPDQKDSDNLPPYPELDTILKIELEDDVLSDSEKQQVLKDLESISADTITRIRRLIKLSEYKRKQAPPIIRLKARAFGTGRQVPISTSFR